MRVGHNPARFVEKVAQPAVITVTVVNCIPFTSGYYEQSLDVLKACLNSIHENTPESHDLMVFDNHSCREVRQYLQDAYEQGIIQYLILSDKNIGKLGAWNFLFGAAEGKYVVFSDGDILFRPGWLPASLELFETFPECRHGDGATISNISKILHCHDRMGAQVRNPGAVFEEGMFVGLGNLLGTWAQYRGTENKTREDYPKGIDYRLIIMENLLILAQAISSLWRHVTCLKRLFLCHLISRCAANAPWISPSMR